MFRHVTNLSLRVPFVVSWLVLLLITTMAIAPAPKAQSDDLQQKLVGYWRFDEGRGEIAYDETIFRNDGRVKDAKWVVGLIEFGLHYYGKRGVFVEVPDDASLDAREELTLACWVCLNEYLFEKSDEDAFYLFAKSDGGVYSLRIEREERRLQGSILLESNVQRSLLGEQAVPFGRWTHVAFTYGMTGLARLYIDGELDREGQVGPGFIQANTTDLFLGSAFDLETKQPGLGALPGVMDEARIYQRALTSEEIQLLAHDPALDPKERPCGNCYAPPTVEEFLRKLMQEGLVTQEQFLRWLLLLINDAETLPMSAPIEEIVTFFLKVGVIPEIFPLNLDAWITKGEAALLLLRAIDLETPLLDQLLLAAGLQAAAEAAFEIAVREGLLPPGRPEDLLSGSDLGSMSLPLLTRLETSPPPFFEEKDVACAQTKRLFLERTRPPLPPLPPPEPPSS